MKPAFSDFLRPLSIRDVLLLCTATLLAGAIYLSTCAAVYRIGFPLDDSWIHLTFARNLAEHGEWSFRLGMPSAGSTSPLWSILLAFGFLINLAPYIWTFFLGLLILWLLSAVSEVAARRLIPNYTPRLPWIGFFIVFEWHLLWAAISGMETLLHGLIASMILTLLMMRSHRYLILGLIAGLSVWVRPDGLTLLGPLTLAVLLNETDTSSRMRGLTRVFIGFGGVFLFYLLFNLLIGGAPMPNTFYAKQAEYVAWQSRPFWGRLGEMFLQLFAGPSFILIPGVILWTAHSIRSRSWGSLLALAWSFGYMFLYILRLPVYHHGRYIIPAMPILFLFGLLGMVEFSFSNTFGRYHWFVNTLWNSLLGGVVVLFVVLGANSYVQDVAIIESQMVDSAEWANTNLPPEAVIAAHDIGALGYFDSHPLLDMAGLVSPEVVPFIRDETRLAAYLDENHAEYLIAFPDLYDDMTIGRETVFTADTSIPGGEDFAPMTIYRWK